MLAPREEHHRAMRCALENADQAFLLTALKDGLGELEVARDERLQQIVGGQRQSGLREGQWQWREIDVPLDNGEGLVRFEESFFQ